MKNWLNLIQIVKISLSELILDKKNQAISCPLEIENTRLIEGKCIYFMIQTVEVEIAQSYCQVIFGPDSNGTLYEPSSNGFDQTTTPNNDPQSIVF